MESMDAGFARSTRGSRKSTGGRRPAAEADMERYFGVTPPSVNQMVLTLEAKRLIERAPGLGRSIRLLIAREELPDLT